MQSLNDYQRGFYNASRAAASTPGVDDPLFQGSLLKGGKTS